MKFFAASDHGGFPLKKRLFKHLQSKGLDCTDLGCDTNESCDYPDFAALLCRQILKNPGSRGLLVCGTGIGMSIAANRFHGIRAALCHNSLEARLTRLHNDANVLVLGGRIIGEELAIDILENFLETPFEGGRHSRRVEKIDPKKIEE
ncbi:MAG: ribose 5-phosphate isomerase B [Candidatus Riflebacteria bacterium]|nr:ribose 5-phosphate isomerase B [Candidatus Riflebacteria bacterium]